MPTTGPERSFVEADYLRANPDVARAVAAGSFTTGWQHWTAFGRSERRSLHPSEPIRRSRREKLLDGIDLTSQVGIEIGPLAAPLVRKDESTIFYVDHVDTENLRRKYR